MAHFNRDNQISGVQSFDSNGVVLPSHVINSDKKRRQRRTYTKIVQRAGFISGDSDMNSLSCIERENHVANVSFNESGAKLNKQMHVTSKANSVVPWLGAASKSLMSSIQSSRICDVFARPRIMEDQHWNDADEKDNKKATPKMMPVSTSSERILNIRTSITAAGPLGQNMYKTNISEGFGKLIYPNGTVFIGMLENDVPHGHGKALYGDASYEGNWSKGYREGQGKFIFSNGCGYYEGGFLHNNFHGAGTFASPSLGIIYSGQFNNGNVCGEYKVKFGNGEQWEKTWPDSRLNLHEAINKLVKERGVRSFRRRGRSSAKSSVAM